MAVTTLYTCDGLNCTNTLTSDVPPAGWGTLVASLVMNTEPSTSICIGRDRVDGLGVHRGVANLCTSCMTSLQDKVSQVVKTEYIEVVVG